MVLYQDQRLKKAFSRSSFKIASTLVLDMKLEETRGVCGSLLSSSACLNIDIGGMACGTSSTTGSIPTDGSFWLTNKRKLENQLLHLLLSLLKYALSPKSFNLDVRENLSIFRSLYFSLIIMLLASLSTLTHHASLRDTLVESFSWMRWIEEGVMLKFEYVRWKES